MLIAVNYHYLRDSFDYPYEGIWGITPQQFERQLLTLSGAGTWISGDDLLDAVRGRRSLPERALLVTFDDGFHEHYDAAWPILKKLGIPAIFYVNTQPSAAGKVSLVHKVHLLRAHIAPADFLAALERGAAARGRSLTLDDRFAAEVAVQYRYDAPDVAKLKYLLNLALDPDLRDALLEELFAEVFPGAEASICKDLYLTRDQMRAFADAGALGNHTHAHLPLGLIPPERAEQELNTAANLLETWTGRRPITFSYPYGSRQATSSTVGEIAARNGYVFGFTMERAGNPHLREPVHLARLDTNDAPGGKAPRWTVDNLFSDVPRRSWYGA